MKEKKLSKQDGTVLYVIQREIDIVTAALLLTGQFTVLGIFIAPGSFSLSAGGPITGVARLEGKYKDKAINAAIDAIDILTALLLLMDKINVNGLGIAPEGFSLSVGGPPFGGDKIQPTRLHTSRIFNELDTIF
ncbi:hypothetical protein [Domibacillus indicus]|uniref:hypothetical protein n=1 Tax=Domibacillus indicus TaxID=1437523 RepID=UPI000696C254|nr:hypothetical protein [Domibacillus indicus]